MKELFSSLSKKEWRLLLFLALLLMIITGFPYLYGYLNTAPGQIYLGIHSLTPGDFPVYFSHLEQVKEGNLFFKNLYSSEIQSITIFNIFWLGAGFLGKIFNLPPPLTFHFIRLILIPLFLIIAYLFLSFFFQEKNKRKICLIFLLFSSGLGVYLSRFIPNSSEKYYQWPMDLWVPESNTFLTLYQSPHLILSLTLILGIFLCLLLSLEKNKTRYSLLAGFLSLILLSFHPFYAPVILGIPALYLFILFILEDKIKWSLLYHYLLLFLLSFPPLLYYLLLLKEDWITQQKAIQNICLTPSFWIIIISYGFLFYLAFLSLYFFLKKKEYYDNKKLFLIIWFLGNLFLIYFPFNWQRRLTEGLHVVTVILAVFGLFFAYDYLKEKLNKKDFNLWVNNKYLIIVVFLFLFSSSLLFNLFRDLFYFQQKLPLFYLSQSLQESMLWFKKIKKDEHILASPQLSLLIPGFSGRSVFTGHGVETPFFEAKIKEVEWFFKNNNHDKKKKAFLLKNNINYLFYSEKERKLGEFKPEGKKYLKEVFKNKEASIYQVNLRER